jgi:hypothetical protein
VQCSAVLQANRRRARRLYPAELASVVSIFARSPVPGQGPGLPLTVVAPWPFSHPDLQIPIIDQSACCSRAMASEQAYGVTPPISVQLPTEAELRQSDALLEELKRQKTFESPAETAKRSVNVFQARRDHHLIHSLQRRSPSVDSNHLRCVRPSSRRRKRTQE